MKDIKLVAFDLDDTLWDGKQVLTQAEEAVDTWIQNHHPTVATHWNREQLKELRLSLVDPNLAYALQLSDSRQRSFLSAAAQVGYAIEDSTVFARDAMAVFLQERSRVTMFEGVEEMLAALAEHYILVAISNGNCRLMDTVIGPYFEAHLSAEICGSAKPDIGMLKACERQFSVTSEQCCLVGDSEFYDGQAARDANWLFMHFNVDGVPGKLTINNINQLVARLATLTGRA